VEISETGIGTYNVRYQFLYGQVTLESYKTVQATSRAAAVASVKGGQDAGVEVWASEDELNAALAS
jgi:hypothetical protein